MSAQGHAFRLKSQQDISGALARLPAPAFVFDVHSGRILAFNSHFENLVGYSAPELGGLEVEKLQPPERISQCHEARTCVPPQGLVHWQYCRKDGELLDVRVHYREVEYSDRTGIPTDARLVVVEFWQASA